MITPPTSTVIVGRTLQLSASVRGGAAGTTAWSVVEANGCGSVAAGSGLYTAPATVPSPAACHVRASSGALSAVATLTIVVSPVTGQRGVWENVTPSEVSLDPNYTGPNRNFGTLGVVADPVRPSDLYAFICLQGVWKSTDFGLTWRKVNTGTKGAVLDTGLPWAVAIDPSPARDASTPPTLYAMNGYGSEIGVFKSTDGGVNWTKHFDGEDAYSFDIDPYDSRHIISGMHEAPGMAESTDGGVTWRKIPGTISGTSIYAFFIDTGVPETTRNTWLLVPQIYSGTATITTNGGSSFQVTAGDAPNPNEGFAHPHGSNQMFRAGPGVAYIGAAGGVWRTQDSGATWRKMFSGSNHGYQSGVIGTTTTLYSWANGSNQGGIGQGYLYKAPRSDGAPWTSIASPSGMNNGPYGAAVTFDGAHHIIIGGALNAGIWRYVEE